MAITIVQHQQLPEGPFRLSVRIDPHLLSAIDLAMESFQETDTVTSVMRKARKAWADIAQGVSQQLFQSEVTPLRDLKFYWPKTAPRACSSEKPLVEGYESFGMVFDRGVADASNPPVVNLVARKGENGHVVFNLEGADEEERSRVNEMVKCSVPE